MSLMPLLVDGKLTNVAATSAWEGSRLLFHKSVRLEIHAVAYKERDIYTMQGIEHDVVAHAARLADLPAAFERALVENISINLQRGKAPLFGIGPAPDKFREMFERAEMTMEPVHPRHTQVDHVRPAISARLAELAAF